MTELKIAHDDDIIKTDEGLVFNPYNPLNIKITLSEVQSILSRYGIPPNVDNMALYERAFVHRSYIKRPGFENIQQNITIVERPTDCMPLSSKSNERLEFLGDGVLECVTKYLLYRRFPKADEGFMTEKKIAIVKNEAIGKIALEMGLHKWLIISKHAEEKKIRTNLKKLGCLFESFIGALFLDFNKVVVKDDENWFQTMFVTGPGFQMAQKFVESVFEKHIDWTALIQNDDNYKNILQVKIQKEFKVTPHYLQIEYDDDLGYKMGVYLCLGQHIYNLTHNDAVDISFFKNFKAVHEFISENGKALIFMGLGQHKIKRKAEQIACNEAIQIIETHSSETN
jgi:dsRNA-specific ribonuclease